jgi:hypothetical protein
MEGRAGHFRRAEVCLAEDRADRLALELLAPADEVLAMLPASSVDAGFHEMASWLRDILSETCGLPPSIDNAYARQMALRATGGPNLVDALGLRRKIAG